MLYFSGYSKFMGNVDDGTTIMDFLPEERKRGITIQSAAITFGWPIPSSSLLTPSPTSSPICQINLIDTPGHVDFTFEVERSLSVLDGVIALIDGVEGVQAQTRTVWHQANRHGLPRIVYLNKLDRLGAEERWETTVRHMQHHLHSTAPFVMVQVPLFHDQQASENAESRFKGVLDLIHMKLLTWKAGQLTTASIPSTLLPLLKTNRRALVEQLGNFDDALLELYLESENPLSIPPSLISDVLCKASKSKNLIPVLFGASFRDMGIQPLLDAVVQYLPPPSSSRLLPELKKENVCAFVFKVVYDEQRSGYLSYVRVYSGTLLPRQIVLNHTRGQKERIQRILMVYANEMEEVSSLGPGDIGILIGLKETCTGDQLGHSCPTMNGVPSFTIPTPVVTRAIEPMSLKEEPHLRTCLAHLHKEDPSIRVMEDPVTCQLLVSGMGELHLEIIAHRLQQLGGRGVWGPLTVAYREILMEDVEGTWNDDGLDGHEIHMKLSKLHQDEDDFIPATPWNKVTGDSENVFQASVQYGPLGYPMVMLGIHVVHSGSSFGLHACLLHLLKNKTCLVEPIMRMTIRFHGCSRNNAPILADLAKRKGRIVEVDGQSVVALVPLANIVGYATALRSLTAGYGTYEMQLEGYAPVQTVHSNPHDIKN
ncbi:G elongation factor, mitochondrial 2 [Coelomomyces lativittatus]|nr:G elongation factor, mitochondrial 2 [Coelomomyces lativittatus]